MLDLALDDPARTRDPMWLVLVDAHDLQRRRHRCERVPELVAEHREELVLSAVDLRELVDFAPQGRLEDRALFALCLERGRLLLQCGDHAAALVCLDDAVALGRRNRGMRGVDVGEWLGVSSVVEVLDRVGTEKRERLLTGEGVP